MRWNHVELYLKEEASPAFVPGRGCLMGHTWAPTALIVDYNEALKMAMAEARTGYKQLQQFIGKSPIDVTIVDNGLAVFVDDVAVQCAAPTWEELHQGAEAVTYNLEKHLQLKGYSQNSNKQKSILGYRGVGSYQATRKRQRQGIVCPYGEVVRQARYLGYQFNGAGDPSDDINMRIRAGNIAWSRAKALWRRSELPFAVIRILFLALVQNTFLTGLEIWVIHPSQLERITRAITKKLRYLLAVRWRRQEWGGEAALPGAAIRSTWRVATAETEVRIRRLRMYQSWAKRPEQFVQPITAVFGTLRIDKARGLLRCDPDDDGLGPTPTPWALQLVQDLLHLDAVDSLHPWLQDVVLHPLRLFIVNAVREVFVAIDVTVLRAKEWTMCIPPADYFPEPKDDASSTALATPCQRDECQAAFATYGGLATHVRFRHNRIHEVAGLVTSNQCPWCMTTFSCRRAAARHLTNAVKSGTCREGRTKWEYPVIIPPVLQCPVCPHNGEVWEHFQVHMRQHHPGPSFLGIALDSDSDPPPPTPRPPLRPHVVEAPAQAGGDRKRRRARPRAGEGRGGGGNGGGGEHRRLQQEEVQG